MGGERNRTREREREGVETPTPSIQPVGGVSCRAVMRASSNSPRPPVSMGLFGFSTSTSPHLTPHGSGQRSSPRHTPPAAGERERERGGLRAGARNFPHLLAFRLYFFYYSILSSPSSVLSPPPYPLLRLFLFGSFSFPSPLLPRGPVLGGLR